MKFSPEDDRYIYELISKNIKYFRLHNNSKYSSYGKMTQEQLAAKMQVEGISLQQKSISRIEDGSRVVADYELKMFAKIFQVSLDFLVEEDEAE